jgi:hypothetical protein
LLRPVLGSDILDVVAIAVAIAVVFDCDDLRAGGIGILVTVSMKYV